jgi:hypothetical protein
MPNRTLRLPGTRRSLALLAATIALAACSNASPSPSTGPGGSTSGPSTAPSAGGSPVVSPGPTVGAIDHKTGATHVILRIEQGGGLVPMEFIASQAPGFTLYGDGVVVFQPVVTTFPEPDANGASRGVPWRTARLDEDQIEELLEFALTNGGLGAARASYQADGIADAPNTIFTIHAGGIDKTVTVNALSEENQPGPDSVARRAFAGLAKRLLDFDRGGSIASDVYLADRYRAVIIERENQPALVTTAWPWAALTVSDFKAGAQGGTGPTFPHRALSAVEVGELKVPNIEGGVQGLTLKAPDGKLYSLILRPLLVDEPE